MSHPIQVANKHKKCETNKKRRKKMGRGWFFVVFVCFFGR